MAITFEFKIKQLEVADKPHMQERITKAIQAQITPKNVDMPLPWAPIEEVKSEI